MWRRRVIRTQFGDYVQALRISGASFETRDDAELNNWHARLNVLWRNISSPGIALWSHLIRRSVSLDERGDAATTHRVTFLPSRCKPAIAGD